MSETTEVRPAPPRSDEPTSLLARFALWNPVVAAGLALAGILGVKAGALQPLSGFQIFAAGAVLGGLASVLVGAVAMVVTYRSRDFAGRRRARLGASGGLVLLAIVFVSASAGFGLPRINDITTDPDDPPVFHPEGGVAAHARRDMTYPPDFAAQQRATEAYADLETIRTAAEPREAWRRARDTAETLGWEIRYTDEERGVLEAWTRSTLFEFVDYVSIRVRPAPGGGSEVDLRSASRDGQGDLGANAERIRRFAAAYPR